MKKIVKLLFFTAVSCALASPSFSQEKPDNFNSLGADMKKVIRDYPHQFASLKGEPIEENPQSTSYDCTFKVSGAENSSITVYSASNKNICSWQALMLTTDDFEQAKKKFRSLYNRFNNLTVKMDYGETFYLKGKYITPVEERNFTSTIMSFQDADQITSKMKVEISMQYELLEWKVSVLVYEREKEDTEQGEAVE